MNKKTELRALVRGTYDIQKLRVQIGNRIVSNYKSRMGIETGKKECDQKEAKKILDKLRKEFKLMSEGASRNFSQKNFKGTDLISDHAFFILIQSYENLYRSEKEAFCGIKKYLDNFSIWNCFLKSVKGVGEAMAGIIISEIDIEKAKYASSIWRYAGLDVASDGRGRSMKKEHLIKVEYVNRSGETKKKDSITFNPLLKAKLIGVLGGSFLKTNSPYREYYDFYKHRLDNEPQHQEKTVGHKHNMSIRYMVKMFLRDLYKEWREIEGLTVHDPYSQEKLGLHHGVDI